MRQVLIFKRPPRRPLSLFLSSSLYYSGLSGQTAAVHADRGRFIRFGTCHEAAAAVAAPVTGRRRRRRRRRHHHRRLFVVAAPAVILPKRPAFCQSSAPVSQLIHGCCYTFAHSIRYMTARSPSPSSFSPARFTPLEKATYSSYS